MKQILKVMGTSFIIAIVVLGLLTVLNTINFTSNGKTYKGIFEILGMASTIENVQYSTSDEEVFESVVFSKRPDIYFDKEELEDIVKGKNLVILKYFKVKYNGNENTINAENMDNNHLKILDIIDSQGKNYLYLYDNQLKTINFDHSDIYKITFYIMDNEQKETMVTIKIAIN